jgi:hypothetical protein
MDEISHFAEFWNRAYELQSTLLVEVTLWRRTKRSFANDCGIFNGVNVAGVEDVQRRDDV